MNAAEGKLGVPFHPDYRRFLWEASDISYSVLELATITIPGAHTDLFRIALRARGICKLPLALVPTCEDNADYYCLAPDGRVIFWSHAMQAPNGEEWLDLAA